LDGILFEKEDCVSYIYDMKKSGSSNRETNRDVIQKLSQFLHPKKNSSESFNSVIISAAIRIQSVLVSHRDYYSAYKTDCEMLVRHLVNRSNTGKTDAIDGGQNDSLMSFDYITVVSLSHLLMVPGISKLFF